MGVFKMPVQSHNGCGINGDTALLEPRATAIFVRYCTTAERALEYYSWSPQPCQQNPSFHGLQKLPADGNASMVVFMSPSAGSSLMHTGQSRPIQRLHPPSPCSKFYTPGLMRGGIGMRGAGLGIICVGLMCVCTHSFKPHLHATNMSGGRDVSYALYGYQTTPPPFLPKPRSLPTSSSAGSA